MSGAFRIPRTGLVLQGLFLTNVNCHLTNSRPWSITEKKCQTMPMKNPPHPGELIRENLKDLGLSVADAAAGLGVTRQQLYNVINGKSGITPEMALRLEKAFGGSADIWLRMQVNYDLAQVRRRASEITVVRLSPRLA